ncbi:hypothetical protein R6Z07M_013412 [Ovis aries]
MATGPLGGLVQGAGPVRARGLPEDVEPAAIQAVLQPVFLPQGTFGLRNARSMRVEKAKATVMEFVENINHSAIPGEIRAGTASRGLSFGGRGRRSGRLTPLLGRLERPVVEIAETEPEGAGGHRRAEEGLCRATIHIGKRDSEDSSEESLGLAIQEMDREDLSGDEGHSRLQASAEEFLRAEDAWNRVKVQEAGCQAAAVVLRKASDNTCWNECVSPPRLSPRPPSRARRLPGALSGAGGDERKRWGRGLLELAALRGTYHVAEVMEEEKEKAWEGGRLKLSKGHLGEVLALQAARGNW